MRQLTLRGLATALFLGCAVILTSYLPQALAKERAGQLAALAQAPISNSADVDTLAQVFSDQVLEFKQVVEAEGQLDEATTIIYRRNLAVSFAAAYNAIERIEKQGDLVTTEVARSRMQEAIGQYMMSANATANVAITTDLQRYSRFMTQALISRSIAFSETVE